MATKVVNGLEFQRKLDSSDNGGVKYYPITSGYATNLFQGDPVKLSAGRVVRATNGATAIGVFAGAVWTDANNAVQRKNYFPAGTTSTVVRPETGVAGPVAVVVPAKDAVFYITADATMSAGQFGGYFLVNNMSYGDTATGMSKAKLNVGGASPTATNSIVKVVGLAKLPDNYITDATPIMEVVMSQPDLV